MKIVRIALLALLFAGCSSSYYSRTVGYTDDLYAPHDRTAIAQKQQAIAEAEKAMAEAEKARWEARKAQLEAEAAEEELSYQSVLADTYESAYARRMRGFESLSYNLPSSYYELRYSPAYTYVTAYDPMNYNIVVMGDQVWVEPKYISSMFGSWGSPSFSMGFGSAGWYAGWHYDSFWPYNGYYSWYGYPHYSWYDWYWGYPYYCGGWWPGYYPGYYPGYWPGYYPDYGPGHGPGGPHHPSTPHYRNYRPHGGESGYRGNPSSGSRPQQGIPSSPRNGNSNYRGTTTGGNYRLQSGSSLNQTPRVEKGTGSSSSNKGGNYRSGSSSNYRRSTGSTGTKGSAINKSSSSSSSSRNNSSSNTSLNRSSSSNYRSGSSSSSNRGGYSGGGYSGGSSSPRSGGGNYRGGR